MMTTGSTAETTESERTPGMSYKVFKCYMLSKTNSLLEYSFQVGQQDVRVVSANSGSVKFSHALDEVQAKTLTSTSKAIEK